MITEAPRTLGSRYEVGEFIGRGGMAEVHLGYDTRLGRTVAIKMLRADLARDTSFLTRFRREAQSAAGLSHHAIVAVYDSGEDIFTETGGVKIDVPYIVMEYVDGQTLREILNEEGKLAPNEAARVMMGILLALKDSHDKDIVHRDIKPANVMLTKGGSVKVMDFGIARALGDTSATMTSAQAVVGTARYLSPEQAQGDVVDARSDLYSAGCLFYELLTGCTPFVGEPVALAYQHITDPPKPPSVYEPSVPREMDAVTLHALAKPRDERYQTAADFRADLQAVRTGQSLSEGAAVVLENGAAATSVIQRQPQAPTTALRRRDYTREIDDGQQPPRHHIGLWVVAVVVALLATIGIGYLVMNGNKDSKTVAVPNVAKQSQAQAILTLRQYGFDHVTPLTVKNDTIVKGDVVNTYPREGTQVDPVRTNIVLNVSGGLGLITVPDVAGKSQANARSTLQAAGFNNIAIGNDNVSGTQYVKSRVASTSPSGNTQADSSTKVSLNISNGKVQVPTDLLGMDGGAAQNELTNAHLKIVAQSIPVDDQDEVNTVQRVSPSQGKMVDVNSIVTITVGAYQSSTVTQIVTPSSRTTTPSTNQISSAPSSAPPSSSAPLSTSRPSLSGNLSAGQ